MTATKFPGLIPGFTLGRTMCEVGGLVYRVVVARGTLVRIHFDESGKSGWSIPEPAPGEIGHLVTVSVRSTIGIDAFRDEARERAFALANRLNQRVVGGPQPASMPGWPTLIMLWWKTVGLERDSS